MKTTISGAIAALAGVLSFIAGAPPELQDQIPQLFPEHSRGMIALWLRVITGLATLYFARSAQDKLHVTPPQTTTTTTIQSKETVATKPPEPTTPT